LPQCGDQVSCAPFDGILLSEKGLADAESARDCRKSEAEFDPIFADSIVPSILAKELASQTTGKSELRASFDS
jgi:hypothetical protein